MINRNLPPLSKTQEDVPTGCVMPIMQIFGERERKMDSRSSIPTFSLSDQQKEEGAATSVVKDTRESA